MVCGRPQARRLFSRKCLETAKIGKKYETAKYLNDFLKEELSVVL